MTSRKSCIFLLSALAILTNHLAIAQEAAPNTDSSAFVDIANVIPSAQLEIRYYMDKNFLGTRVAGYEAPKCLLTKPAAHALKQVQDELAANQQSLKIFDCYRPQQAVDHFVRWALDPDDQKMKDEYYPSVEKRQIFSYGYIAEKSGHSRGSTVDLTLVDLPTGQELNMGTDFDFFDPLSHTASSRVGPAEQKNRLALKAVMERNGFKNLAEEWWHYTLENEPFPNTYFDFKVQ